MKKSTNRFAFGDGDVTINEPSNPKTLTDGQKNYLIKLLQQMLIRPKAELTQIQACVIIDVLNDSATVVPDSIESISQWISLSSRLSVMTGTQIDSFIDAIDEWMAANPSDLMRARELSRLARIKRGLRTAEANREIRKQMPVRSTMGEEQREQAKADMVVADDLQTPANLKIRKELNDIYTNWTDNCGSIIH